MSSKIERNVRLNKSTINEVNVNEITIEILLFKLLNSDVFKNK